MCQTKDVDKIKIHIRVSNFFSPKIVPVVNNVEKYSKTLQATDDSIIWNIYFACWITTAAHKHKHTQTLQICNTSCICTATVVIQTRLDAMIHGLSCFL